MSSQDSSWHVLAYKGHRAAYSRGCTFLKGPILCISNCPLLLCLVLCGTDSIPDPSLVPPLLFLCDNYIQYVAASPVTSRHLPFFCPPPPPLHLTHQTQKSLLAIKKKKIIWRKHSFLLQRWRDLRNVLSNGESSNLFFLPVDPPGPDNSSRLIRWQSNTSKHTAEMCGQMKWSSLSGSEVLPIRQRIFAAFLPVCAQKPKQQNPC